MRKFFTSLFTLPISLLRRRRPAPALPFVPFHPDPLSEEDIRKALAHRGDEYIVRAIMQIIAGEMFDAIHGMAGGDARARGEFYALSNLQTKLESLVRGKSEE